MKDKKRNTDGKVKLFVRRVKKRGGGYIYPKPPREFLVIWVDPDRPPPNQ